MRSLLDFEIDDWIVINSNVGWPRYNACPNSCRILPSALILLQGGGQETKFLITIIIESGNVPLVLRNGYLGPTCIHVLFADLNSVV